jgi:hypothetical protein
MNKEELVLGGIYEVSALGFGVAIWTGDTFKGPVKQYGKIFFRQEQPYWEGLPYGTCTPKRRIGELTVLKPYDGANLLAAMNALDELVLLEEERKINEIANIR